MVLPCKDLGMSVPLSGRIAGLPLASRRCGCQLQPTWAFRTADQSCSQRSEFTHRPVLVGILVVRFEVQTGAGEPVRVLGLIHLADRLIAAPAQPHGYVASSGLGMTAGNRILGYEAVVVTGLAGVKGPPCRVRELGGGCGDGSIGQPTCTRISLTQHGRTHMMPSGRS
jgi:hypothetical protein